MAEATGQSLLAKNSIHSVCPIIRVSEPPSRSGMTNSPAIGMKQSSAPAATPGQRQRQRHQPERLPARTAEIGRRFQQRLVHLLQRGVERQHHERQIGIDDADIDRGVGREPGHRRVDDVQPQQHVVEQAVALQDVDPGIDADQERGPERQDHQHHQERLQPARRARDAVGDRIADREQDRGRDGRDLQALEIGDQIERVGAEQRDSCRTTGRRRNPSGRPSRRPDRAPAHKAAARSPSATG